MKIEHYDTESQKGRKIAANLLAAYSLPECEELARNEFFNNRPGWGAALDYILFYQDFIEIKYSV